MIVNIPIGSSSNSNYQRHEIERLKELEAENARIKEHDKDLLASRDYWYERANGHWPTDY